MREDTEEAKMPRNQGIYIIVRGMVTLKIRILPPKVDVGRDI